MVLAEYLDLSADEMWRRLLVCCECECVAIPVPTAAGAALTSGVIEFCANLWGLRNRRQTSVCCPCLCSFVFVFVRVARWHMARGRAERAPKEAVLPRASILSYRLAHLTCPPRDLNLRLSRISLSFRGF